MFIETYIDTDNIIKVYFYYLRNYGGQPGLYTTYYARGYDIYPHGPDYLPYLGEYIIYYPPGDPPPYLWTNYEEDPDDRYERVYYVVVTPRPYLNIEYAPIAWTKTINFFTDPENWWAWNYDEYYFYLNEGLLPGFYLPIFNNFPHPQGPISIPRLAGPITGPATPPTTATWIGVSTSAGPMSCLRNPLITVMAG